MSIIATRQQRAEDARLKELGDRINAEKRAQFEEEMRAQDEQDRLEEEMAREMWGN